MSEQSTQEAGRERTEFDHLASVCRALRAYTGRTMKQVAERTGLTPRMVGRIERGDLSVRLDAVSRLAGFYGLRIECLFWQLSLIKPDPTPTQEPSDG